MNKNEIKFLVFLFIVALFLRLIFFDMSYLIWDETVYLMHGEIIGGGFGGYEELTVRPPVVTTHPRPPVATTHPRPPIVTTHPRPPIRTTAYCKYI